jgi:hypothetical protein
MSSEMQRGAQFEDFVALPIYNLEPFEERENAETAFRQRRCQSSLQNRISSFFLMLDPVSRILFTTEMRLRHWQHSAR